MVGDNAVRRLTDGGGSSELKPKDYVSPLSALQAIYGDKVKYAPGYTCGRTLYEAEDIIPQEEQDKLRAEAVAMAKDADVVIYIGGLNKNAWQDCESTDRREYELPFGQNQLIEELIKANPNIVIANIAGNAYEMPWAEEVPAILHTSYLGTMGGATIADVIAGNVNPSGKLPYSIPVKLEDCGANSFGEVSYPGIESEVADVVAIPGSIIEGGKQPREKYMEDILVGYRWHDTKKIPALFPFGYGLSYTDFEYGKATASSKTLDENGKIEIEVPITNKGNREGSEIVQLYISDEKSSLPRPVKELKGFDKVKLAPGETRTVKFTITPEELKFFDDKAHEWVAEPGKFKALIGASSTDIHDAVEFSYRVSRGA